ncbi:MAG: VOC family protein [Acidobacteriota bacterium]
MIARTLRRIAALMLLSMLIGLHPGPARAQASAALPDTGVSGVYEAMIATDDAPGLLRLLALFGFRTVAEARVEADAVAAHYGVDGTGLTAYRLQNGAVDAHGLIRLLAWDVPLGPGVGYAPPETLGSRLMVMRTDDIVRIADLFEAARAAGEPWLVTGPVYDDLFGLTEGTPGLFNRPAGVREMGVYGATVNLVFFQRYAYTIPGYGTVDAETPLRTSELTHHDFVLAIAPGATSLDAATAHYAEVLGLRAETDAVRSGDWQIGPQTIFALGPGESHWYRGFVSPNNICGKLKFFVPDVPRSDRSDRQRVGALGISLHSLAVDDPAAIRKALAARGDGFAIGPLGENPFGETSFVFTGPDGVTWEILQRPAPPEAPPVTVFRLDRTPN